MSSLACARLGTGGLCADLARGHVGCGISVYQVFTGKQEPPKVFSLLAPTLDLSALTPKSSSIKLPEGVSLPEGGSLPSEISLSGDSLGQMPKFEIIPAKAFNQIINMSVYLLLMGFISSLGSKVAFIGVRMIKDIVVKGEKPTASQ